MTRAGLLVLLASSCGCGGGITPADTALVAVETDQQRQCVDVYRDAGPAAQDACRTQVRATWDAYWSAHFDGGAQ